MYSIEFNRKSIAHEVMFDIELGHIYVDYLLASEEEKKDYDFKRDPYTFRLSIKYNPGGKNNGSIKSVTQNLV